MRSLMKMLSLTLYLLLLFLFISASKANPIGDLSCTLVDCGQGKCNGNAEDKPPFFFECECDPGWTKLDVPGLFACIIPDCLNSSSCSLPSPPPFTLPSNLTDPCAFSWCGNGTCVPDGIAHSCNCYDGAFNLLNMTGLPCFQECYAGSDCKEVNPSPPSSQLPPGGTSGASGPTPAGSGSGGVRRWIGGSVYLLLLVSLQLVI